MSRKISGELLLQVLEDNQIYRVYNRQRRSSKHIESNWRQFEKLRNDPSYRNVCFDNISGGVKAIHLGHIIHNSNEERTYFAEKLTATELELLCQNVIFKKGRSCILLNEYHLDSNGNQLPQLDTLTDGIAIDIRAITQNNGKTIRNSLRAKKRQLKNYNIKTNANCNSVILYFHEESMFDEPQILSELGKILKSVICVFKSGKMITYKKQAE